MIFEIDYTFNAFDPLGRAAVVNLFFGICSVFVGFFVSIVWTLIGTLTVRPIVWMLTFVLSFIRGTPLLIQIFCIYFLLPRLGLELSATASALIALTLHTSAFMTEIMRGGLASIPPGQYEAARALGLKGVALWFRVIMPQAVIKIVPPLINEFVLMMKATPLVSVIAITEALRTAQQIYSANFRALETLVALAVIFFLLNFTISRLGGFVERRLRIRTL